METQIFDQKRKGIMEAQSISMIITVYASDIELRLRKEYIRQITRQASKQFKNDVEWCRRHYLDRVKRDQAAHFEIIQNIF